MLAVNFTPKSQLAGRIPAGNAAIRLQKAVHVRRIVKCIFSHVIGGCEALFNIPEIPVAFEGHVVFNVVVDLGSYILTLLVSLLVYITLSESWNLMGGYAGQVNLGLAAYFGIGSLFYMLVYRAGPPWYVALLVGGLAGGELAFDEVLREYLLGDGVLHVVIVSRKTYSS